MYGLKHHVEGEKGMQGNPEPRSMLRYGVFFALAAALLAGGAAFAGWFGRGSVVVEILCVVLLIGGLATLVYESQIENRGSYRRR
jgi:hypothetical protein